MPEYMQPNSMNPNIYEQGMPITMGDCVPLNPSAASFIPRAYFIDQPYMGMLQLNEGLKRGTVFPNIILPEIK